MKVMTIADMHLPFVDKDALKEVYKAVAIEKPDAIVQIGDLLDQYVFSKYTRDLNLVTPSEEVEQGYEMAKEFWSKLNRISKNSAKFQLLGNHDTRVNKRVKEKLPELEVLLDVRKRLYTFDRVKVMKSDTDFIILDNVVYVHGWLTKLGDHAAYFNKSVVHGHSHKPGLIIKTMMDGVRFELDVGHMADDKALPLNYTASKMKNWVKAYGIVDNQRPYLEVL